MADHAKIAQAATSPKRHLLTIFVIAIAIRWFYDLAIFTIMGVDGLVGTDSSQFLGSAQTFATAVTQGSVAGWQWLGHDPYMMPLMLWLVAANVAAFSSIAPIAYVFCQGILDAATCIVIYYLAATLDVRLAKPAAIFAAVNPTQIILAGIVYTDTPFVFFVAVFLLASLRFMRTPSWTAAIVIGLGIGAAALTRVLVVPWAAAALLFLLAVALLQRTLTARVVAQIATAAAIFMLCIAPVLIRNLTQYDAFALTPQYGPHLSRWVAPLVKEMKDGTPWIETYKTLEQRGLDRFGPVPSNPFVQAQQYRDIAMEELRTFSVFDIARAWAYGAALNMASPAVIQSPLVAALPRTGFFATPGRSMPDKIGNFLFHSDNVLYAWIALLGITGVIVMRMLQLVGLVALLVRGGLLAKLALLGGWCAFILIVNGPVGQPKYRLPMEPVLVMLSAAGWTTLRRSQRQKRK